MFWVYGIKSQNRDRIYIGQTRNLEQRLEAHNTGLVQSTKKDRPWGLIALESFETLGSARWREFHLKKSRGRRLKWLKNCSAGLRAGGG
jgi:predicted GIY-YIG superfamily endonuclease